MDTLLTASNKASAYIWSTQSHSWAGLTDEQMRFVVEVYDQEHTAFQMLPILYYLEGARTRRRI